MVEPSKIYQNNLKNFLRNLQVKNVKIVASIGEARREMLSTTVGLFIVERQLPEKSGLQFCRELRREAPHHSTPFLLLGSDTLRNDIVLASEGGVDAYLLKPFSLGEFSEQLDALVRMVEQPSHFRSLIDRAERHIDSGETWVAEALLMEAQALQPQSARALCGMARIAMLNSDDSSAMAKLTEAIALNPDYIETYKHLLLLAKKCDDQTALMECAKSLHQLSPDNPRYPLIMADLALRSGDVEVAEKFFKNAIELSPRLRGSLTMNLATASNPGRHLMDSKRLEKSLDLESSDGDTIASMGQTYVVMNMLDEGIKKLQMALHLDPTNADMLWNLASAFEQKGDRESMMRYLRLAVATNPFFEKARKKIARFTSSPETMGDRPPPDIGDQLDDESSLRFGKKGA